jgi:hypothetical protein
MTSNDIDEKLGEVREHLAEASDHIARAVEEIAVQERIVSKARGDGRAKDTKRVLQTRKDGLAVIYKRLETIQDDLSRVTAPPTSGVAQSSPRQSHRVRRVA